jgi:phosphate-selective porin OprO/OprP
MDLLMAPRQWRRRFFPFALSALATAWPSTLPGQTTVTDQELIRTVQTLQQKLDEQHKRLDDLEKQNRSLREGTQQAEAKANAETTAKETPDQEGWVVGSTLGLTGRWNHGPWFETPDKSFKIHVGGRTQFDIVGIVAPNNVMFGQGGTGPFDDAVNFRRARLEMEGAFWEVFNFKCEYDFLNTSDAVSTVTPVRNAAGVVTGVTVSKTTFNTPVPTDLWVEMTQAPLLGNVRVGNQKPVIGFEHLTSSRWLNFLERSYQFDSFIENGNNGFTQGISAYNGTSDERATLAAGLYKTNQSVFGWNVGDGEWSGASRATWLPVWEDEGRSFVHLGIGGEYRGLDRNAARLRSRNMLRNGPALLHTIVAIAQLEASQGQALVNPEFVVQCGPLLIQAEYTATVVGGVNTIVATPTQANRAIARTDFFGQGAYVEVLYFLTGEHRTYNKKIPALGRVIPFSNAFFGPGAGHPPAFSRGAWQVGARYSWLDLNDGAIRGGEINSLTLGLNWFLNPNFKIQGNYEVAHRDVGVAAPGSASGNYQGVGMRFAFDF